MQTSIETLVQGLCDFLHDSEVELTKTHWLQCRRYRASTEVATCYEPSRNAGVVKPLDMDIKPAVALAEMCTALWHKFVALGEKPWTTVTLIMHEGRRFEMDLGYEDFYSEDFNIVTYRDQWEAKHFKGLKCSWK